MIMYEDFTTNLDLMHFELDGLMTAEQYDEWQAHEHDKVNSEFPEWGDLPF